MCCSIQHQRRQRRRSTSPCGSLLLVSSSSWCQRSFVLLVVLVLATTFRMDHDCNGNCSGGRTMMVAVMAQSSPNTSPTEPSNPTTRRPTPSPTFTSAPNEPTTRRPTTSPPTSTIPPNNDGGGGGGGGDNTPTTSGGGDGGGGSTPTTTSGGGGGGSKPTTTSGGGGGSATECGLVGSRCLEKLDCCEPLKCSKNFLQCIEGKRNNDKPAAKKPNVMNSNPKPPPVMRTPKPAKTNPLQAKMTMRPLRSVVPTVSPPPVPVCSIKGEFCVVTRDCCSKLLCAGGVCKGPKKPDDKTRKPKPDDDKKMKKKRKKKKRKSRKSDGCVRLGFACEKEDFCCKDFSCRDGICKQCYERGRKCPYDKFCCSGTCNFGSCT